MVSKISATDRNLKSAYPANSNLNRNYNQTGINFNNNHNANISGPSINSSIQLNNINLINSVNLIKKSYFCFLFIFIIYVYLYLLIKQNKLNNFRQISVATIIPVYLRTN